MGELLIKNLDDAVIARFKWRAEITGRTLEETIRDALEAAAPFTPEERMAASKRLLQGQEISDFDVLGAIRAGRGDESERRSGTRS
jgi:plasmid stability protein